MSEPTTAVVEEPKAAEAAEVTETPDQTIAALREALKKANSEAKDNRIKAQELDKIKQDQMSDLERAQADLKEAREAAAKAAADALRLRIASTHGITAADAEVFLTAGDEETLTLQAKRLVELQGSKVPANPLPDPTQGGRGATPLPLNGDGLEEALRSKLGIA